MSTPIDRTIDDPNQLFRFALLLTGNPATAGETVLAALKKAGPRIAQIRDARRRRSMLMEHILSLVPAARKEPAQQPFEELPKDVSVVSEAGSTLIPAIAQLPDPMRAVAAYFYSNLFTAEELPSALGWPPARTAQVLQQARFAILHILQDPAATTSGEAGAQS